MVCPHDAKSDPSADTLWGGYTQVLPLDKLNFSLTLFAVASKAVDAALAGQKRRFQQADSPHFTQTPLLRSPPLLANRHLAILLDRVNAPSGIPIRCSLAIEWFTVSPMVRPLLRLIRSRTGRADLQSRGWPTKAKLTRKREADVDAEIEIDSIIT